MNKLQMKKTRCFKIIIISMFLTSLIISLFYIVQVFVNFGIFEIYL